MRLAFIGFGDLGHYMKDTILEFRKAEPSEILYFDDNLCRASAASAFAFERYADDAFADAEFFVCLGYKHLARKGEIISRLVGLGRRVPYFVHPSSYVHPSVRIGSGSFVYPGCSVDRNTVIGNGVFIANGDVIPHDCVIADCCWFGASVTLSGKVSVGPNTFIGSGSTVSNDLRIGANVIIGLGTVVTKHVADHQSVIGNPMRILDRPLHLI